jgi:hypothetical protein
LLESKESEPIFDSLSLFLPFQNLTFSRPTKQQRLLQALNSYSNENLIDELPSENQLPDMDFGFNDNYGDMPQFDLPEEVGIQEEILEKDDEEVDGPLDESIIFPRKPESGHAFDFIELEHSAEILEDGLAQTTSKTLQLLQERSTNVPDKVLLYSELAEGVIECQD